jgi:integrase
MGEGGTPPADAARLRHSFASFAIASGVNAKALSIYMGNSGVSITLDRYGHLMPGNEAEAAGLLDAYLDAASG